jgi:ferredoxin-type protein NapH
MELKMRKHRREPAFPARAAAPVTAASALAIAAFAYEAWFFNLAGKSGEAFAGGMIWALFCTGVFAIIALGGKPDPARRVFFCASALAFIPSFIARLIEARGHMAVTGAETIANQVPFCHIALTTSLLPNALLRTLNFSAQLTGARAAFYPMLAYWLLSLVTLGRGWCSWVCFYGGLEDGISSIPHRARFDIGGSGARIRRANRAVLAFVAMAALGTLAPVYCDWLCPFKLVTEYAAPVDLRSFVALVFFVGLFLALVVVLPLLTKRRTQCSILCPFGAMQSLLDRISPFRVAVNSAACVDCGACDRACPMIALNSRCRAGGRPESSCVKCGTCFSACPKGAIGYAFRGGSKKEETSGTWLGRFSHSLLAPSLVFPFTALSFGMIVSTAFSSETMTRLVRLAMTGRFFSGAGQ